MTFTEVFQQYMTLCSATITELSGVTGLSKSTLSRFKNGKRDPSDTDTLRKLAAGFSALSRQGGDGCLEADEIYAGLFRVCRLKPTDFTHIASNLNILIDTLGINANSLSQSLNYDASYLSRIRSGQRRPADVAEFCGGVAAFVSTHHKANSAALSALTGLAEDMFLTPQGCRDNVQRWLSETESAQDDTLQSFLRQLDDFQPLAFQLNDYTDAAASVCSGTTPTAANLPPVRDYYTLAGFMEAELDWLQTTILSPAEDSVIAYSDMPIEAMSTDSSFSAKWRDAIAAMLKRGLHLHIIHHLNRSFYEMMLGLENWIPLYMTGQVSPYYFTATADNVFHHFLRVSGAAALSGQAIVGFHEDGQYHLTKDRKELDWYRKYGENLLAKAHPLMEIYRRDTSQLFSLFLDGSFYQSEVPRRNILSTLPLYTLTPQLLEQLLAHNHITASEHERITAYARKSRDDFENCLARGAITDELPLLSEEEFAKHPISMPLADVFYEKEIFYTYELYRRHMELTRAYADGHPTYRCIFSQTQPFRNIQIRMAIGECAVISKNKSPAIHFVVKHPKLRQAIENIALATRT